MLHPKPIINCWYWATVMPVNQYLRLHRKYSVDLVDSKPYPIIGNVLFGPIYFSQKQLSHYIARIFYMKH